MSMSRWMVLFMVLALALVVVACGSEQADNTITQDSSSDAEDSGADNTAVAEQSVPGTDTVDVDIVEEDETTVENTTEAASTEEAAAGSIILVSVTNDGFHPDNLTITAGDTVIWENSRTLKTTADAFIVGVRKCIFLKSPTFSPGESWNYTFIAPIICNYVDGIQTTQSGTITVE